MSFCSRSFHSRKNTGFKSRSDHQLGWSLLVSNSTLPSSPIQLNNKQSSSRYLHRLALDKAPFWLVAVFAYVASYSTSLFSQAGHILLEKRTTTTPGTSRPTLYEQCVSSLTSHVEILNMEGIVRDGAYGLYSLSEKTWKSNHLLM